MMIMDAGVHVWRPQAPDRPWMPGRKAHLPEPLTYEKFSAMMKEAGVEHAILVPPSWEGDRVDYSLSGAEISQSLRCYGTLSDRKTVGACQA
jgi:predicted TIM-barrel fold metal-dependent hydrolase